MEKSQSEILFTDALEKMIDSQIANTEALTALKVHSEETNRHLSKMLDLFSNGFRTDIKMLLLDNNKNDERFTAILDKMEGHKLEARKGVEAYLKEMKEELAERIDTYKRVGFWIKTISCIVGGIAAVVGGILGILKVMGVLN